MMKKNQILMIMPRLPEKIIQKECSDFFTKNVRHGMSSIRIYCCYFNQRNYDGGR